MNMRRALLVVTLSGFCGAMIIPSIVEVRAQGSTAGGQQMTGPHHAIEDAASKVKADDESSIRSLADAAFDFPHSYSRLPADMETVAKNRLVQAETAHRQGRGPGVQEDDIVRTVNLLVARFGAPNYAATNQRQVRHLRMRIALAEPNFMGVGMSRPGSKVGDSVNTTMSPLQAAHLMAVLIDQKLTNPDYQIPPDEWDPGKSIFPKDSPGSGPQLFAYSNQKTSEMRRLLSKSISTLTPSDVKGLVDQTFGNLGIK